MSPPLNTIMTPCFYGDLVARNLPGKWWELTKKLEYRSRILQTRIVIPPGFVTDLASVRIPLVAYFYADTADRPSVVHDWLYRDIEHTEDVTRREADQVFYEAMGVVGYGWWYRHSMYYGLRAGGWGSWKENEGYDPR